MPMPDRLRARALAQTLATLTLSWTAVFAQAQGMPQASGGPVPRLGQPISAAEATRWDLNVFPDGRGLPPGRGTAAEGAALYQRHCQACHGEGGRGASAPELAGGSEPLTSLTPDQTIGLYWPYATTVFDYIRRAKPMLAPGTLSADEVYALTAWLLQVNGVVGAQDEMNAKNLAAVRMPNREGFVGIDAPAPAFR
jgi:mono/diheme cytochrome c family protein